MSGNSIIINNMILNRDFFSRDATIVAKELCGRLIVKDGHALRIVECEAYLGECDSACHARAGITPRTRLLYGNAGYAYVYLCYGMHWLLNAVVSSAQDPQCVLIRACEKPFDGPAKLTKALGIDGAFNGADICSGTGLWFEDDGCRFKVERLKRVGIDYAAPADRDALLRYKIIQ